MENGTANLRQGPATTGEDAAAALLAAATAGCAPELAQKLMLDVVDAAGFTGGPEHEADDAARIAAALQMMAAAAPRDPLEAMLAAQMAAAHTAAMRAMRRAAQCAEHPQIEALYARQADRLMGLFMRQTEALERRRASAERREAAATAETGAHPIAVRAKREKPPRPPRQSKQPKHPPARCNGAPPPRNGRRHRINGTGPPP